MVGGECCSVGCFIDEHDIIPDASSCVPIREYGPVRTIFSGALAVLPHAAESIGDCIFYAWTMADVNYVVSEY